MKEKTFVDKNGKVIAKGVITELLIDLVLNDGSRFYSTRSDNYTIDALKQLKIEKAITA